MSTIEAVVSMCASAVAIIGGIMFLTRWLDRRFSRWTNAVIDNSAAMRNLALRVQRLESTIHNQGN
jgi:Flp pilus assembly pilin Flp